MVNKNIKKFSNAANNIIEHNKFFKSSENKTERNYNFIKSRINILLDDLNVYKIIIVQNIINKILNKDKINDFEMNLLRFILEKILSKNPKNLLIYGTIKLVIDNMNLYKLNDNQKKEIMNIINGSNNNLIKNYLKKYNISNESEIIEESIASKESSEELSTITEETSSASSVVTSTLHQPEIKKKQILKENLRQNKPANTRKKLQENAEKVVKQLINVAEKMQLNRKQNYKLNSKSNSKSNSGSNSRWSNNLSNSGSKENAAALTQQSEKK